MANPRVEATYARAMAAFQEGSFDAARRLIGEILIDDPGHAGARALRTRLEARTSSAASGRSGHTPAPGSFRSTHGGRANVPEATSVDPTVLIDRASSSPFQPPEYIEPTVVVQREDVERYRDAARAAAPPPPAPAGRYSQRSQAAPAPEPTIMIPPKKPSARSSDGRRPGGLMARVKDLAGASPRAARPAARSTGSGRQPGGFWTPTTRGAAMAVGGIVVAAVLIVGVIGLVRWLWPGGYVLTIARPVGGTIVGAGFQCGTRGSDCALTKPADDTVELKPVPDSGYVFAGFTGDCAPTSGRVLMTKDKSCGATFGAVAPTGGPGETGGGRTWTLTIEKPTGGTIVGDSGGISCGTLGTTCTASIPDGTAVELKVFSDKEYQFLQFTGDCGTEGTFTMTGARLCGASFAPTPTPLAGGGRPARPPAPPASGGTGSKPSTGSAASAAGGQPVSPPPVSNPPPPPAAGQTAASPGSPQSNTSGAPSGPGSPPPVSGATGIVPAGGSAAEKAPEVTYSAEAHAKKELDLLPKRYCAALETMQPDRLKEVFPQVNVAVHRDLFRQYKSIKCTVTGPPEYERLDATNPAGFGQMKVGIKQEIQLKTGGAPTLQELVYTMVVSRLSFTSPWVIDRLQAAQKPK